MSTIKVDEKAWHVNLGEVIVTGINDTYYRYVTPQGEIRDCSRDMIVPWAERPMPVRGDTAEKRQVQIMLDVRAERVRQETIMDDVRAERVRQDEQYGPANECGTMDRMFVVLGEEFGEACQAHLSARNTGKSTDKCDLRKELIQTAAVCVAMCERIDAAHGRTW